MHKLPKGKLTIWTAYVAVVARFDVDFSSALQFQSVEHWARGGGAVGTAFDVHVGMHNEHSDTFGMDMYGLFKTYGVY